MVISGGQMKKMEVIAKKFGLAFLALFGSQARGGAHAESDVDVGYRATGAGGPLSARQEQKLAEMLAEAFGREVDLRSLHSENPYFLFSVMGTAQFLAGDHTAFARFRSYAFALRHDARYDLDLIRESFRRKRLAAL
ncbi:MAG: nucleotidyltransferase domain-containing protein [bacterium]